MDISHKKPLFLDEIISKITGINQILKKKRVGILKNPSILNKKNQQSDDLFSEQMFLLNLSRNESITRIKTLKVFRKNLYDETTNHVKMQPDILKKQASLKEILISSKKLKMLFDEKKLKREPCVITELWSDQYYRSLFKHSKLDNLIKESDKEKIWRFVKQKAILNNSKTQFSSPHKTQNYDQIHPYSKINNNDKNKMFPILNESKHSSIQSDDNFLKNNEESMITIHKSNGKKKKPTNEISFC